MFMADLDFSGSSYALFSPFKLQGEMEMWIYNFKRNKAEVEQLKGEISELKAWKPSKMVFLALRISTFFEDAAQEFTLVLEQIRKDVVHKSHINRIKTVAQTATEIHKVLMEISADPSNYPTNTNAYFSFDTLIKFSVQETGYCMRFKSFAERMSDFEGTRLPVEEVEKADATQGEGWIQKYDFEFRHSPLGIKNVTQLFTGTEEDKQHYTKEQRKNLRQALRTIAIFHPMKSDGHVPGFMDLPSVGLKLRPKHPIPSRSVSVYLSRARSLLKKIHSAYTIATGKGEGSIQIVKNVKK